MSALFLIPHNEERSLLPIIEKIGRAVKFEYLSAEGELIQSEGIIDKVHESGIEICEYSGKALMESRQDPCGRVKVSLHKLPLVSHRDLLPKASSELLLFSPK